MLLKELVNGRVITRETSVEFAETYDLLIVGLGTAGAIALITASGKGIRVLGVERLNAMGGTGTLGTIDGYYFGATGGLYTAINMQTKQLEQDIYVENSHCDAKIYALEQAALQNGAQLRYGTQVTGVYTEGENLCGVRLLGDEEELNVGARAFIDATGEAELCHMAGCACQQGRAFDGQTQPFTNSSVVLNDQGRREAINRDAGYVNQSDSLALGHAILCANTLDIHLKEDYLPGKRFVAVSPIAGIREGRVIIGRKTLHLSDVLIPRYTEKEPLFYAFSNADNHGKDIAFEDAQLIEWYVVAGLWGLLFSVPVPLDAMLPREYENLAVAGRCLSVDHDLASCVRMKSDMEKCGEAVAQAVVQALQKQVPLCAVPYDALASALRESGCLDTCNHRGFVVRTPAGAQDAGKTTFSIGEEEILRLLAGEKPGAAIWACKLLGESVCSVLREAMRQAKEPLMQHAAMALGLCGDVSALPVLRQMLQERDAFIPRSSLKYVYTRCTSAIYLCGKLGDTDSIQPLLALVASDGCFSNESPFTPDELYACPEERRAQEVLFAVRALTDIAKANPDLRTATLTTLRDTVCRADFSVRITLKANPSCFYELAPKVRAYVISMM